MRKLLGLICALQASTLWAAESELARTYEDAVAELPRVLQALDVAEISRASTDRFTLVIARAPSGAHVTLTIRSVEDGGRAVAAARTDDPRDEALENRLVAALLRRDVDVSG